MRALLMSFLILTLTAAGAGARTRQAPKRYVVMVFDQMRPDYIERFDLKNFKRLRKMGRDYKNAYVGHLASVTVVSHAVLGTGLLPKDLPWSDDVLWDRRHVLGPKDALYSTTDLSAEEVLRGLRVIPTENFLASVLKASLGKKIIAIGEKNYAAAAFGGPYADSVITLEKSSGVCRPAGRHVPSYILENKDYTLDCHSRFGTDRSFYPLDGFHYFAGVKGDREGGDKWTADVALEVMKREDWGALLLTFGAIDKFSHMLGEVDHETVLGFETPVHLAEIVKLADKQLGRILDELEKEKLLSSTIVVATADHAGTTAANFLGEDEPIIGDLINKKIEHRPFWIERLQAAAKIKLAYGDTGIRLWLADDSEENHRLAERALEEIPHVTAIFRKKKDASGGYFYAEVYHNWKGRTERFKKWARLHDRELANSMAAKDGPDYSVNFDDASAFGKLGEHGGSQEAVQRIPLIMAGPGVVHGVETKAMRLFELSRWLKAAAKK
jgi:hypothetical protein